MKKKRNHSSTPIESDAPHSESGKRTPQPTTETSTRIPSPMRGRASLLAQAIRLHRGLPATRLDYLLQTFGPRWEELLITRPEERAEAEMLYPEEEPLP